VAPARSARRAGEHHQSTPIPERFAFLIPDGADQSERAAKEIERADAVVVLDISDLGRIGDLGSAVQAGACPWPASITT